MTIETTRRQFIQNGLSFVSMSLAMPHFLMRAAQAADSPLALPALPPIPAGKILVVLEMSGGNDGLNTVVPYADPGYALARPTIGLPKNDVVKISNSLALHPRMGAFGKMFEKGQLAVVTGVGYPNPNRSHFFSMDIWQTGLTEMNVRERSGWLARYFDADGHLKANPLSGVTVGSALPLALFSETSPCSCIGDGYSFGFRSDLGDTRQQMEALSALYAEGTVAGSNAEFVRNVGMDAYLASQQLKAALQKYDNKAGAVAKYPVQNGLAATLQTLSKLITGGVGTRVYYLSMGGFDTHANQPTQHGNLLGGIADAVSAFFDDLALQGRAEDVVLVTFSEFGRRVKENGSAGTDHGAASVLFVAGPSVKGGIYGQYPSLSDLDDGDLKMNTDFRSVYATLIEKWLGADSQPILGGSFPHLSFV
jgi:uncharacterized protein (DUF1501 family)